MREQFEKLPEIDKAIKIAKAIGCKVDFEAGSYVGDEVRLIDYLNGAYYAYQEQQKIINMQECGATEIRMILEDSKYNDSAKLERISELLK